MNIILLGAPGSGKGTQAKKLLDRVNYVHISTGDLLRNAISEKTEIGELAERLISNGKFVDDQIVLDLVREKILSEGIDNQFIFDGFPRTIEQAYMLDQLMQELNIEISQVVNIELSEESVVRRITGRLTCLECGETYHKLYKLPKEDFICDNDKSQLITRKDDTVEVVKARYETYESLTRPLIEYYTKEDLLINVNGSNEIDQIFAQICEKLEI